MRNICQVEDCGNFVHGNGYCDKHYMRIRLHGTLDIKCVGQSRVGSHNGFYGVRRFGEDNPFFGKKHTQETIEQNRQTHLGIKLSDEHKAKIKANTPSGENSPHWKGDNAITPINILVRTSLRYKNWSRMVKERDDFICVQCGQRGGELHSDHIKPFAYYPELRFELSNGRTLCVDCHRLTPTYCGKVKNLA